jgi:hypothetical protein
MKWIEERDALIAQTKAFVEAVARRSADASGSGARPVPKPVHRDAAAPNSEQPLPAAPPSRPREVADKPAATPASAPLPRTYDQVSMSSEIRARIAAFRAHQERFNRERHEYFNATLARLRAEINKLPAPAPERVGGGASARRPDITPPLPAAAARPEARQGGQT